MGILNATPDSFFADSRKQTEKEIADRANEIVAQGGTFIDVGAYSTRPGATEVSEQEEMARMRMALAVVRREQPDVPVSIDTFRPDVARMAVEEYGADIINDVSEGEDEAMFRMVARLGVPYILMSVQKDLHDTLMAFAKKVQMLRDMGQKDIILDLGFVFGKTVASHIRIAAPDAAVKTVVGAMIAQFDQSPQRHGLADVTALQFIRGGKQFRRIFPRQQGNDLVMSQVIRPQQSFFDQGIHLTSPRR